jgi:hypothetical protein
MIACCKRPSVNSFLAAFLIVGFLTFLSRVSQSAVFFYLLYPGAVLDLLVEGGHGGSTPVLRIAQIVGFLLNSAAYACLIAFGFAAVRRLRNR